MHVEHRFVSFHPTILLARKSEMIYNMSTSLGGALYVHHDYGLSGPVQFTEDYWKELQTCQKKKFLFPKVNMKAYICILIPLNILANAGL